MADTIHEAVWDWLLTCPYIGDIFFNAGRATDGNTVAIPSETILRKFIDGSSIRRYNVALTRFQHFSTDPNDEGNVLAVADIDRIAGWVEDQNESETFPAFPDNDEVRSVSVLPNTGGWIAAQDEHIAKYTLQFEVEYLKN